MTSTTPTFKTICPHCGCPIRSDRLQKHMRKAHSPQRVAREALQQSQPSKPKKVPTKFVADRDCIERVGKRTGMELDRVERFFEYVELEWIKQQPRIGSLLPYPVIEKTLLSYFDTGKKTVTAKELADVLHHESSRQSPQRKSTSVYAVSIPIGGDPSYKLRNNRG